MSTIVTSSHFIHCFKDREQALIRIIKWTLGMTENQAVYRERNNAKLTTFITKSAVFANGTREKIRWGYAKGDTPKEWRDSLLKGWKTSEVETFDCDACKHKLACMVVPYAARIFEKR